MLLFHSKLKTNLGLHFCVNKINIYHKRSNLSEQNKKIDDKNKEKNKNKKFKKIQMYIVLMK